MAVEILDIEALNARFESSGPGDLLRWAAHLHGPEIWLATSFGAEDMVLLDFIARDDLPLSVFYLDTGRLHQETYDAIERARERYGVRLHAFHPDHSEVSDLLTGKGPNSFYRSLEDRKECCAIRKVRPLAQALKGAKGWITGQRREQAVTRTELRKVEIDEGNGGILKLNPLADWSEDRVWTHIREHDVPYNELHDRGFPSIGCAPCTRAIHPGEDSRAGRWWWESPEAKECGLHAENGKLKLVTAVKIARPVRPGAQ